MKRLLQQSRLQYLVGQRNGYLLLALCSIISNLVLICYQFTLVGHERTVIVPPSISKTFWVNKEQVSADYLAEMAVFFTQLRLTLTPSNVSLQRDLLLRYVAPQNFASINTQMQQEAERLKVGRITTAFYPVDVTIDANKWLARITGDLETRVGLNPVQTVRITYEIHFSYHNARLLILSFSEVSKHG